MSGTRYIAQDTLDLCHQALRDGRTLEDVAGKLHFDCECLGRLLQLPTTTDNMVAQPADYLWSVEKLDGVL